MPVAITKQFLEDEKLKTLKAEKQAHDVHSRNSREFLVKNLREHYEDYHNVPHFESWFTLVEITFEPKPAKDLDVKKEVPQDVHEPAAKRMKIEEGWISSCVQSISFRIIQFKSKQFLL